MNDANWIKKVDFGWYAVDENENLAVIFSELHSTPKNVLNTYSSFDDYSWITDYVIDEMEGDHGMGKLQDVSKGFYVYEYNNNLKCYECLAIPKNPIKLSRLDKFKKMICRLRNVYFGSNIPWESGNI